MPSNVLVLPSAAGLGWHSYPLSRVVSPHAHQEGAGLDLLGIGCSPGIPLVDYCRDGAVQLVLTIVKYSCSI